MIPVADYHFNVGQLKRSAGQSAVASAAYQACEKLNNQYYGEVNDYSYKGGLIISEIMLPDFVPDKFKDRETLWNEVEKIEKRKDAQLAYKFNFALMNEFTVEENIEIAREFIRENFVKRGMICDWAFHLPESDDDSTPNPHIHLMCPIRPMKNDGTWGEKQKNVFLLDENGNPILNDKGKPKYNAVKTTDWSEAKTLVEWRKAWEEINNRKLEEKGFDVRISSESLEARGLDLIPTIHEGPTVRAMEKKGVKTEKGEFNRWVKKVNEVIKMLRFTFRELYEWIQEQKHTPLKKRNLVDMLSDYCDYRNAGAYSQKARLKNLDDYVDSINYLVSKNIINLDDFESALDARQKDYDDTKAKLKEIKDEIAEHNKNKSRLKTYNANREIGEKYEKKSFGRDKFYKEHKTEIDKYLGCKKNIPAELLADPDADETLDYQIRKLQIKLEAYNKELEPIDEDLKKMKKIKRCIDVITGAESETEEKDGKQKEKSVSGKAAEKSVSKPAPAKSTEKAPSPQKKESVLGKLNAAKEQVNGQTDKSKTPARNKSGQEL